MRKAHQLLGVLALLVVVFFGMVLLPAVASAQYSATNPKNPNDQGIGMQGVIPQAPPTQGATISLPTNGQSFSTMPVTVTGLCPDGLLVKISRNNVFAGAAICANGSFSIEIDLYYGQNELVAHVFDDLDQEGPISNAVTITYPPPANIAATVQPGTVPDKVSLSSNFGRRGADPHTELSWPIILSGGTGPYAFSIDWGDGTPAQLMSQDTAGNIIIKHTYDASGVYKVIVKVVDKNGESSFLQLVAIANGTIAKKDDGKADAARTKVVIMWQPMVIVIPFMAIAFWLGRKYQLKKTRYRMKHKIFPIDR